MEKLFAIPTENGKLCAHFGHCEKFAVVKTKNNEILDVEFITPPVHQPGVYPKFLADNGISVIISGGMGVKAQQLFAENNIEVSMGVSAESPQILVQRYLDGQLETGENLCDH
jgi:predicted Fe-Mo cluster-binding NifX family protein